MSKKFYDSTYKIGALWSYDSIWGILLYEQPTYNEVREEKILHSGHKRNWEWVLGYIMALRWTKRVDYILFKSLWNFHNS